MTTTRKNFEAALKFITRYYTPVSLEEVLAGTDALRQPRRPVLVTFDDAYASVSENAAPLCFKYGVPALFFINGACMDNRRLALDNLLCYVANECGMGAIATAVKDAGGQNDFELESLAQVFSGVLPAMSLPARKILHSALLEVARLSESDVAAKAGLYMSSQQLRGLGAFKFEIGNHTYSHMNCRSLLVEEFPDEIGRNKTMLEAITETRVRSFSVPYGSSADLTCELAVHVQETGHEAVFLAEGCSNSLRSPRWIVDRVSIQASNDASFFSEIEILPRLRKVRNAVFGTSNSRRLRAMTNARDAGSDTRSRPCSEVQDIH